MAARSTRTFESNEDRRPGRALAGDSVQNKEKRTRLQNYALKNNRHEEPIIPQGGSLVVRVTNLEEHRSV